LTSIPVTAEVSLLPLTSTCPPTTVNLLSGHDVPIPRQPSIVIPVSIADITLSPNVPVSFHCGILNFVPDPSMVPDDVAKISAKSLPPDIKPP